VELSPQTIRERLDHWPVARLATLGPDLRPHQVPIVFARAGELLWSPIDAKPKSGRELARVRNVRERPHASLLLDEYDDDWSRLWWIRIDATARLVAARDAGPALAALRAKYPQYRQVALLDPSGTLLAFAPDRIRSWSARSQSPSQ
jgi:PPOX class probable F420-dependent enzyme